MLNVTVLSVAASMVMSGANVIKLCTAVNYDFS
jgi:hypothetical protein